MNKNRHFAHTSENGEWQTLEAHLQGVAEKCRSFDVDHSDLAYLIGYLHDLGKFQEAFQEKLHNKNIFVDHSTSGAKFCLKELVKTQSEMQTKLSALVAAYCIAGHHAGLPDGGLDVSLDDGTLASRMKNSAPYIFEDFNLKNINISFGDMTKPKEGENVFEFLSFFTRFKYSALVDGDFLDTEEFVTGKNREEDFDELPILLKKLDHLISTFNHEGKVNQARAKLMSRICDKVDADENVFTLDSPTGSGKTILSMKFALERAIAKGRKKIIYVIPYTSIIEQNAKVFKDIFGEKNVLEHHSNYETDESEEILYKQISENWSAPIIVTTNVQFFESIYACRSSKMRKIHSMANAVICFDEAHVIPFKLFNACMNAISYIKNHCQSDVLLMSATLPDFEKFVPSLGACVPLIEDRTPYIAFKRATLKSFLDLTEQEVLTKIDLDKSTLIVVNLKKTAQRIYHLIESENKFLLTTYLTPKDRRKVIGEIKNKLKMGEKLTVVSTSLVEAGVDLDFDEVYRELNGVDSILQCMGRCNREGKKSDCSTYIFKSDDLVNIKNNDVRQKCFLTKMLLKGNEELDTKEMVGKYMSQIFEMNKQTLSLYEFSVLEKRNCSSFLLDKETAFISLPFRSFSEKFKYIDEESVNIVICNEETKRLLENLQYQKNVKIMRTLAQNSVSVYRNSLNQLLKTNAVRENEGVFYLNATNMYNENTGFDMSQTFDNLAFVY